MRLMSFLPKVILALGCLGLSAQVDSRLKTQTDLSDVYKRAADLPKLVTIYDFTPMSRGVFEPKDYMTGTFRASFTGYGPSGQLPTYAGTTVDGSTTPIEPAPQTLFAKIPGGANPTALGTVFALRKYKDTLDLVHPYKYRVLMYWYPNGTLVTDPYNGSKPLVGIPMHFDSSNVGTEVYPASSTEVPTVAIPNIDHVRFTVFMANNTTPIDILSGLTLIPAAGGVLLPAGGSPPTAPTITSVAVSCNGGNSYHLVVTGTGFKQGGVTYKLNITGSVTQTGVTPTQVLSDTSLTYDLTGVTTPLAVNTITVVATNGKGSTSSNAFTFSLLLSPTLVCAGTTPTVVQGAAATFNGTQLSGVTSVTLTPTAGGTATVVSTGLTVTSTSVMFTVPATLAVGTYNVKVSAGLCGTSGSCTLNVTAAGGGGGGSGIKVRTVDLPAPSQIFTSPTGTDPDFSTSNTATFNGSTIKFDPWSEANPSMGTVGGDTIIGQFFYSADYLAWIFGGRVIRVTNCGGSGPVSNDWTGAPATYNDHGFAIPGADLPSYYSAGGFNVSWNQKTNLDGTKSTFNGWSNRLPVLTRFQATKSSTITAFLNHYGGVQWAYRFMNGAYANDSNSEELANSTTPSNNTTGSRYSTTTDTTPDDTNDGNSATPHLRQLRMLSPINGANPKGDLSYLAAGTTSLQVYGPKVIPASLVAPSNSDAFDNGDPLTPEPISWTLTNTYRQLVDTAIFSAGSGAGCGRVFVIPFPTRGMNDSSTNALDQNAAVAYKASSNGTGVKSYPGATFSNMTAGNKDFAPWVLSSAAAHDTSSNNASYWKAPWKLSTSSDASTRIQTMLIALGVPGAYNFKNAHSDLHSPHVEYFKVAEFANPLLDTWDPSSDSSRLDPGTCKGNVFYYAAASPKDVDDAFADALSYIVQASAALSAPATPATGVRNANEAYFGTFQTTSTIDAADRLTLWSGNMYALGLLRTYNATLNTTVLTLYGNDHLPFSPSSTSSDFDQHNLWSAYDVFGAYQGGFPITRPTVDTSKLISTHPLLWSERFVKIAITSGGTTTLQTYDSTEANSTQLSAIVTKVGTGPGATTITTTQAAELMRFILGAYDASKARTDTNNKVWNRNNGDYTSSGSGANVTKSRLHHVDVMGDIINSAPLALELTADMVPTSGPGGTTPSSEYSTYQNTALYDDPHARLIIVGTNVGQLHCFLEISGKNKTSGYVEAKVTELWSFVPDVVFPMLWNLYTEYKAGTTIGTDSFGVAHYHKYGVDGDPNLYFVDKATSGTNLGDTRLGTGEDAVVVFGFRKGARNYYALQLSADPSNTDNTGFAPTPDAPALRWFIDADAGTYGPASSRQSDTLIGKLGMSTAVPAFATVLNDSNKRTPGVFLSGGFSNAEMDKRFGVNLGRSVMAFSPITGSKLTSFWDYTSTNLGAGLGSVGSIASGVVPVVVTNQVAGLTQRLYFADYNGNILAIDSSNVNATTGFRLDNAKISTWTDTRLLFHSPDGERFTTTPDAYRPTGDYPTTVNVSGVPVKPVTVMVSVGSGDRNNPIDADGSITSSSDSAYPLTDHPPTVNRLYVIADRQDKSTAAAISDLVEIAPNSATDPTSSWPSCYSDPTTGILNPPFNPTSSSYLWSKYRGYYFGFRKSGTLTTAYQTTAYDKILVSPLIKDGGVFYSFFSIDGNGGFDCSPNARTSTFRQCDIFRPLYFDPRTSANKVGDIDSLSKNQDACTAALDSTKKACSGLAFYFNSLSSQLVDAGDYVVQGGAIAAGSSSQVATGANRPDIQTVKDTGANRGFRIRAWRVVR